jgi:hypothetical protein
MPKSYTFLIESERSRNKLFLNGKEIGTFATLNAAKAEAAKVANSAVPGATLIFELDFKWTLTDLEIRAATLEWANGEAARYRDIKFSFYGQPSGPSEKLSKQDSLCG